MGFHCGLIVCGLVFLVFFCFVCFPLPVTKGCYEFRFVCLFKLSRVLSLHAIANLPRMGGRIYHKCEYTLRPHPGLAFSGGQKIINTILKRTEYRKELVWDNILVWPRIKLRPHHAPGWAAHLLRGGRGNGWSKRRGFARQRTPIHNGWVWHDGQGQLMIEGSAR